MRSNPRGGTTVLWLLLCAGFACQATDRQATSPFQGIVEFEERSLSFEVQGRVTEVLVHEGERIAPGQALARLDDQLSRLSKLSLEAQARATRAELKLLYAGTRPELIEQARAGVRAARSSTRLARERQDRNRTLAATNVIPPEELSASTTAFERAEAQQAQREQQLAALRKGPRSQQIEAAEARLDAALAAVETSEERLRRHVLYSDAAAEILDLPVKKGEYVFAGTPVAAVADTTSPFVDVFVPQSQVARFEPGTALEVRVDSLQRSFQAQVEHLSRSLEFTPRFLFSPDEREHLVLRVRLQVLDPERRLRAGIPAFASFPTRPDKPRSD